MTRIRNVALAFAAAIVTISPAAGGSPVALVEQLSGNPAGVEIMDYVETGRVIRLGARQTIVLSYLNSCTREAITGGTVTVGTDQSEVLSGKVERTKVPCDQAKLHLPRRLQYKLLDVRFAV